jgi:hypothetical protein
MVAAVAACIEGTWTDWSAEDGAVIPKPEYCITIQPLEGQQAQGQGQQPLLFGVHIVLLDDKQGASQQQMVQAVEGGIEVVEGEEAWAVRKRLFLSHLYINVIVLPRQARDKHRESTQKQAAVFSGPHRPAAVGGLRSDPKMVDRCEKRHFLSHLYIKCIFLPRQARDKHRENSKKSGVLCRQQLAQGGRLGVRALREFLHSAPASTGDEVRQKEKTRQAF